MDLLLAYPNTPGPSTVTFEVLNPEIPNTARRLDVPSGQVAADIAPYAAGLILDDLARAGIQGFTLAASYPPTEHPRDIAERARQALIRKPRPIDVGPGSGQTTAQLAARTRALEQKVNRLIAFVVASGIAIPEDDPA